MSKFTEGAKTNLMRKYFYKAAAASALIVLVLFLIGITSVFATSLGVTIGDGWLMQLQDNWLIALFKVNMGFQANLDVVNFIDIAIMMLFCVMFLGLYQALKKAGKILSLIAAALPFLGIPIFLVTATAGRSTLLIAVLLISIVILRDNTFSKLTAYVGIVASVLLFFAGDIGTAIFSSLSVIALSIAVGYVLWVPWLYLVAQKLYQLGRIYRNTRLNEKSNQAASEPE